MPASYGGVLVWSRLCAVLGLGSSLETVLTNDVAAHLLSQEKVFAPMRDGYWLDNYIEQRLADAVADEDDAVNLGFVPDDDLRRIIRRDLMEARTCVEARAFKAALVLAGSVAEALILAAVLAKGTAKSEAALTKMGLKELVAEARALNIVPDEKTMNLVDDWLRSYRNLIHPGRERSDKDSPGEDKAALAVQAVELLARQLDKAHRAPIR